jgi:glycosyltransferase involved in cell wall biosynthesis
MQSGEYFDIQPGISAVLAVAHEQLDVDSVVLDVAAVLDGLVADNFEIVVVEFGSERQTGDLLADLRARRPNLPLRIVGQAYPDRTTALAAGFETTAYDLTFVTATDGEFEMLELNHLLEAIERGADLAIGYRAPRKDSVARRLDSWSWNLLINLAFGQTARDVDCEFKLFRRRAWERVRPRCGGSILNAELVIRARRLGFIVSEVAVRHHHPTSSATGRKKLVRALVELRALHARLKRSADQPASEAAVEVAVTAEAGGRAA